ncbi:MAG: hypothetical protein ACI4QM_03450, partial [Alphaproteobacteria bacterium]
SLQGLSTTLKKAHSRAFFIGILLRKFRKADASLNNCASVKDTCALAAHCRTRSLQGLSTTLKKAHSRAFFSVVPRRGLEPPPL